MIPEISQERLEALHKKMALYRVLEEKERCEDNLSEFLRSAWPSVDGADYQPSWAIDAMCDHLEAVTLGHIPRLLINIPPRCSKTTVASIVWPAWTWARAERSYWSGPKVKFLCSSYNSNLSLINANAQRQLLTSPWYQSKWPINLRDDANSKSDFRNTSGGARQSTSVGGSLLGLGGDVLIVDDPHNTETEKVVETDADRAKVASWWKELSSTRLNDPKRSAIVVVMQRLHQGDLSGIILNSMEEDEENWVHLMIPMRHDPARHCVTVSLPQYEDPTPWEDPRVEEDELMWPIRFGETEVKRIENRLGPVMASGRLQQSPTPKGGGIIKREWWNLWGAEEARKYGLEWREGHREFPHCELVVGSLDTSYGEREENDYNALTVWGIFSDRNKNRRAVLMYAWNERRKLHGQVLEQLPNEPADVYKARQYKELGLVELVATTCKRYRVQRLLIEDKTRGRDVGNELMRQYTRDNWGVQFVNPVKDKVSRAHSVVPLFADNAIWAPNTKWAEKVIDQCEKFPRDEHDDLLDTVTQFLLFARENGLLLLADDSASMLEDEIRYRGPPKSIAQHYGV